MTTRSRIHQAVEAAMNAVGNLGVEAYEPTITELVEALEAQGVGPIDRRQAQTKGVVKLTRHGFRELFRLVDADETRDMEIRLASVAGETALVVEVTREDVVGRSFFQTRYVAVRDGVLRL